MTSALSFTVKKCVWLKMQCHRVLFLNSDDGAAVSPDLVDMSPEGPQPPMTLLQQLLASATQPSPVKAIFDKQELEVWSVDLVILICCIKL